MTKSFIYVLALATIFFSCGDGSDTDSANKNKAVGGVQYGGNFRFMSSEKVSGLFPLSITDVYANRISSQIFQGLLKIDPNGTKVLPCLAESFEISEDSKTFTFKIRKGVYFQDSDCFSDGKGREVTAHDFKYSLDMACSSNELNKMGWLLTNKIVGGAEHEEKTKNGGESEGVFGIQVADNYTLKITLEKPFSGFDKLITHSALGVFPKEAFEKYGDKIGDHPVGTGAFILDVLNEDKVILKRNNNYWEKDNFGNQMPFLDSVTMTYATDKKDELLSFRQEKIDLVLDIPVDEIENVLGNFEDAKSNVKHKVDSKSSMSIQYYAFAHESGAFKDKRVRKAFNLALDRTALVESWLKGEGWPALNGFVPSMENYPYETVKGYTYNLTEAKKLMKEAGFANGNGFPTIDLYLNTKEGTGVFKLAEGVAFSLKQNLGVDVNIKLVTLKEREDAIKAGNAIFWRTGWVADYPDPENFLNLFYGGNISEGDVNVNPFKYNNPEFDALFEKALGEIDVEKRMQMMAQCDQLVIDDAVVMPLLTDDFITMINLKVRKFQSNEMEQMDFSTIFIKEIRKSSDQ